MDLRFKKKKEGGKKIKKESLQEGKCTRRLNKGPGRGCGEEEWQKAGAGCAATGTGKSGNLTQEST